MNEEKFPKSKKSLHWQRQGVVVGKLHSHGGECSNRGVEGKVKRFLHRGSVPTNTHQPERIAHLSGWVGVRS